MPVKAERTANFDCQDFSQPLVGGNCPNVLFGANHAHARQVFLHAIGRTAPLSVLIRELGKTPMTTEAAAEEPASKPAAPSTEKPALIPAEAAPSPDSSKDKASLDKQGDARPTDAGSSADPTSGPVYSDSWWSNTRPIVELHGFMRTRGELFHNFSLGRHTAQGQDTQNLWPQPLDHSYGDLNGARRQVLLCGNPANLEKQVILEVFHIPGFSTSG